MLTHREQVRINREIISSQIGRCPKGGTPEELAVYRRAYQREYYKLNSDKARQYQKQYNLTHKKKSRPKGSSKKSCPRLVVETHFSRSRLMHLPVERFAKAVNCITGSNGSKVVIP